MKVTAPTPLMEELRHWGRGTRCLIMLHGRNTRLLELLPGVQTVATWECMWTCVCMGHIWDASVHTRCLLVISPTFVGRKSCCKKNLRDALQNQKERPFGSSVAAPRALLPLVES